MQSSSSSNNHLAAASALRSSQATGGSNPALAAEGAGATTTTTTDDKIINYSMHHHRYGSAGDLFSYGGGGGGGGGAAGGCEPLSSSAKIETGTPARKHHPQSLGDVNLAGSGGGHHQTSSETDDDYSDVVISDEYSEYEECEDKQSCTSSNSAAQARPGAYGQASSKPPPPPPASLLLPVVKMEEEEQVAATSGFGGFYSKYQSADKNSYHGAAKQEPYDDTFHDDDDDDVNNLNDQDQDEEELDDGQDSAAGQLKKQKCDLVCVVCGAAANGYNFDAITCESCKAFFRRNAFRPLNLFRCTNNNACVITTVTRKKCKKCRIMKCFGLGMRRDWIMTEGEREEKRRKIEENRRKKATTTGGGGSSSGFGGAGQQNENSQNDSNDNMSYYGMPGSAGACSSAFSPTGGGPGLMMMNPGGGAAFFGEDNNQCSAPIRRRRRRRRHSQTGQGAGATYTGGDGQVSQVLDPTGAGKRSMSNTPVIKSPLTPGAGHMLMPSSSKMAPYTCQVSTSPPMTHPLKPAPGYDLTAKHSPGAIGHHHHTFAAAHHQMQPYPPPASPQQQLNLQFNLQQHARAMAAAAESGRFMDQQQQQSQHLYAPQQQQPAPVFGKNFHPYERSLSDAPKGMAPPPFQYRTEFTSRAPQQPGTFMLEQQQQQQADLHRSFSTSLSAAVAAAAAASSLRHISPVTSLKPAPAPAVDDDVDEMMRRPRRRHRKHHSYLPEPVSKTPPPPESPVDRRPAAVATGTASSSSSTSSSYLHNNSAASSNSNFNSPYTSSSPYAATGNTPGEHLSTPALYGARLPSAPPRGAPVSNDNGGHSHQQNGSAAKSNEYSVSSVGSADNSPPSTSSSSSTASHQSASSDSSLLVATIDEAYKHAIQLVKAQGAPSSIVDMETTINVTELAVRRIIYFFKMISDFRQLEHDLMAGLLKFSMMKLLQIHGVNSFNKRENTFKEPCTDDVAFPAESLEGVYGPETYRTVMSITNNLCDLCEGNSIFLKIIMLITLFDPLNAALSPQEKSRVEELQSKYISLLYSHLRDCFGSPKAELKYKGFLFEMSKVTELSSWFEKTVAEQANQDSIRPLMKEVFSFSESEPASVAPPPRQLSQASPEPGNTKTNNNISPIPTAPDSPVSAKHSPAESSSSTSSPPASANEQVAAQVAGQSTSSNESLPTTE